MKNSLQNIKIAVPESRQLDVLANLFENRGAMVSRCPLVSIHDSPNDLLMTEWLQQFIKQPPDYLIILTGEGIRRLIGFAERADLLEQWKTALAQSYLLARGPKPNRALKILDLQADQLAAHPTTDGMIESLESIDLNNKTVSVQLYGEDPNEKLQNYLQSRQVNYNTVAPYIYASDVETDKVVQLIQQLANQAFDLICFTSKAQYHRLEQVAKKFDLQTQLNKGLQQTKIAAVGPVVADQLNGANFNVSVMPEEKFFMKPMVSAIENLFEKES